MPILVVSHNLETKLRRFNPFLKRLYCLQHQIENLNLSKKTLGIDTENEFIKLHHNPKKHFSEFKKIGKKMLMFIWL